MKSHSGNVSVTPLLVPFLMRTSLRPATAVNDAERETQVDTIIARAERLDAAAQARTPRALSDRPYAA